MLEHIKRLGRHSLIYLTGDFVYKGIVIFLIPLYTRYLTTGGYGIIESVRAVGSVLVIVYALGLDSALGRFYFDYEDKEELKKYIGSVLIAIILLGLIIAGLFDVLGNRFSFLLVKQIPYNPYIKLILWSSFFAVIPATFLIFLQIQEKSGKYVLFQVFQALFTIGLIVYFVVFLRQGALGQIKGKLYASIILFAIAMYFFRRSSRVSILKAKVIESLKYGLPLIPHCLCWWVLDLSDRIILQKFVALSQVGIYSLGYNIGIGMELIVSAFNKAWVPFLFSTAKKNKDAPQIFSKLSTYYMMVILFVGLAISLFSREIIQILATPKFYEASKVVPVIVLSFIFIGMYLMVTNQIFYEKKTAYLTFISAIGAVTNIILNFLLIPKYGIMGAAYATLLSLSLIHI